MLISNLLVYGIWAPFVKEFVRGSCLSTSVANISVLKDKGGDETTAHGTCQVYDSGWQVRAISSLWLKFWVALELLRTEVSLTLAHDAYVRPVTVYYKKKSRNTLIIDNASLIFGFLLQFFGPKFYDFLFLILRSIWEIKLLNWLDWAF